MTLPLIELKSNESVVAFTEYFIDRDLKLIDIFQKADLIPILSDSTYLFRIESGSLILRIFHSHNQILSNKMKS